MFTITYDLTNMEIPNQMEPVIQGPLFQGHLVAMFFLPTPGGFQKNGGTPIAGWFIMPNLFNMYDLGVPPF
jgi:hypothetical protein